MGSQLLTGLREVLLFLFLLAKCSTLVHAVNINECGGKLGGAHPPAWDGTPPPAPPPPFELTYEQCLAGCGGGLGDISWCGFSQSVITWFIPWVVLGFQIPFGAEYPLDDFCAFFLTLGSPPLAAFSLQITQLNTRWLVQAFFDIDYQNSAEIATVVSALQHTPFRLSANPILLPSLIILPQNGAYWQILLKSARKIRRWSIQIIVNFVWVIVSALLTIIVTFYAPVPGEPGYGTVASLVYLLPLTIGWLYVGSEPESNHFRDSLEEASSVAFVAADRDGEPVLAESLVGQPKQAIEFARSCDVDLARRDELKMNPVFNYSRHFVWSQNAEVIYTMARNAAVNVGNKALVHRSLGPEANVATNRRNWTPYEVICHCTTEDTSFERFFGAPRPLIPLPLGSSESHRTAAGLLPFFVGHAGIQEPSVWATGVWKRVALAAGLALGLQWGTTGAGVFIHYVTHPVGLGCRTISLLIYGILGTVSFLLLLASSILAHLSRPHSRSGRQYSRLRSFQETVAVLSRWLGKTFGIIAGLGILVIALFQPLGIFYNCWCSTMTLNRSPTSVAFMMGNFALQWGIIKDWVGGLVVAFVSVSVFGFSIYFGTPRRR